MGNNYNLYLTNNNISQHLMIMNGTPPSKHTNVAKSLHIRNFTACITKSI